MAVDRRRKPAGAKSAPALRELLEAGEIDVDTYVDAKVEAATAHLRGLTAAELRRIRELLRAQVVLEPELRELVRRASSRSKR